MSRKLNCILIIQGDEIIQSIEENLKLCEFVEVVAVCKSISAIHQAKLFQHIDFVILEHNCLLLEKINVFNLLSSQQNIIVTSSNAQDALNAYELGATDFLYFPFTNERLLLSVTRILKMTNSEEKSRQIGVKYNRNIKHINLDQIVAIEGYGNYIKIITLNEVTVSLERISSFESRLPSHFLRIHKSFIINIYKIKHYNHLQIVMGNGKIIPIGNSYKALFKHHLSSMVIGS